MKNLLITGVSGDLGLHTTQTLLSEGHTVFGIYRRHKPELDILTQQYPKQLFLRQIDLSRLDHLEEKLSKDFLPPGTALHGLVNNAAWAYTSLIANMCSDDLQRQFNINTLAPILLTKFCIRNMLLHRSRGSIVHISSVCAHTGYKGLAMYAASKGALEAFSKNTAREWGQKGIRSNCIVAGFMETTMSSSLNQGQKERIFRRTSLKQATDVAAVTDSAFYY